MKKIFALIFVLLLTCCCFGAVACGKIIPQYEDSSIEMTGNIRWANDGFMYADLNITNKTNADIKNIRYYYYNMSVAFNDDPDLRPSANSASDSLLAKNNKIKSGETKTVSIQLGQYIIVGTDRIITKCQVTIQFNLIDFKNYGLMPFEDNQLFYTIAGYK